MSTRRRSLFLYIALLCMAVFCQYTAHFAKTASQPFRLTSCRVKVAAASPLPESRIKARVRCIAQPPQDNPFAIAALHFGFTPGALVPAEALGHRVSMLELNAESSSPQFRVFYLRV